MVYGVYCVRVNRSIVLRIGENVGWFKMKTETVFTSAELAAFFDDVQHEHAHAVTKYPAPNKNLAALVEEVGEVARALLENKPREQIYNECVQVATMALRIAMEVESL